MAVKVYLERAAVELAPDQRRRALELENARLDALQAPYWERPRNGDIKAAEFVLKIISLRVRMLGLDREAARNDTGPVLIVDGTEEEFVAKMRAIAEHDVEAMEEFWPGSANHDDTGSTPPVGRSPQPTHGDLADARDLLGSKVC